MKKQTKVLAAATLLTLGASFSAMAAAKTGTWTLEEDGWYCYDADGDAYEDEFCNYNGKEFYVGEDGLMVTSEWVDYDGNWYYADEYGEKTTGSWLQLVPHEDEDADEEWYWFKASGKMANSEKVVIGGKTYYFGSEGQMLTGWVDTKSFDEADEIGDDTVYCGEDGARVSKAWVETTVPGADEDEDDEFWYYIDTKGTAKTGKAKSINGATYLFNEKGQMLSGWVAKSGSNYVEIGDEKAAVISDSKYNGEVYFCGDSDDGHVKKNQWIKTWNNKEYDDEDADDDQYWFWIQKDGIVYIPGSGEIATSSNGVKFEDADAGLKDKDEELSIAVKNINDKYYAFNENGEMQSGFIRIDGAVYYFGGSDDGARKTGSVTKNDDYGVEGKFLFSTSSSDKGVGVTGPKSGKLYKDGLLITAKDSKYEVVEVADHVYIVNKSGSIQTTKKDYKDGDEIICKAENATFAQESATKGAASNIEASNIIVY